MQAFGAVWPTAGLVEIREAGEFIQRKRRMCNLRARLRRLKSRRDLVQYRGEIYSPVGFYFVAAPHLLCCIADEEATTARLVSKAGIRLDRSRMVSADRDNHVLSVRRVT